GMPAGSVIVDLAGEAGGNCELTEPFDEVVVAGTRICSPVNLAADMPGHASELYARNITELLELCVDSAGELALEFSDEIIAQACVTGGENSCCCKVSLCWYSPDSSGSPSSPGCRTRCTLP